MPLVSDRYLILSIQEAFGFYDGEFKETTTSKMNYKLLEVLDDNDFNIVKSSLFKRPTSLSESDHPPLTYSGNYNVYKFVDSCIEYAQENALKNEIFDSAVLFTQLRTDRTLKLGPDAYLERSKSSEIAKTLLALATRLEDVTSDCYRIYRSNLSSVDYSDYTVSDLEIMNDKQLREAEKHMFRVPKVSAFGYSIISLGPYYIVKKKDNFFYLTGLHLKRSISLIKSSAMIILTMMKIPLKNDVMSSFNALFKSIMSMSEHNPEAVGRYIKGARSLFIASLADDDIIGDKQYDLLLSDFDADRRYWSQRYLRIAESLTTSIFSKQFLTELYKFIPHPDSNMHRLFHTMDGLTDPNRPSVAYLDRFEGIVRKTLYRSLAKSGHELRVRSTDEASLSLVNLINSTSADVNRACQYSSHIWADTKFLECRTLVKPSDIIVKPANKASAVFKGSEDDFPKDLSSGHGKIKEHLKNVNDLTSVLLNSSSFGKSAAVARFEGIVRAHEEFESKYETPEDIPPGALADFVLRNPKARTIASTEPKYGEYHKEVTRMFYMAEQQIKELTQSVERLTRQVSRKQSGVSIVKSYHARRADLEHFARSMVSPTSDLKPVFISFDMSEFSKKFPMKLLRMYGRCLSELTGEKWLSRLDLFFRSAVVCHNTRGYVNYMAGVKGGFEGFLNFVWSSIHASVMEVALESLGLKGELLAFSDDGLLLLHVPISYDRKQIRDIVLAIQQIYMNLGLEFKLQKTMISGKVWEYLGDICFDGKIIGSFSKELSTMFKDEEPAALSTPVDRVNVLSAKVKAGVKKGMDPISGMIVLAYESLNLLKKYLGRDSHADLIPLLIIPNAYGGCRIPSLFEVCMDSSIEEYSELVADLLAFEGHLPVKKIAGRLISRRLTGEKALMRSFVSGRLVTNLESTKTNKILDHVLEKVREKISIYNLTNPMDHVKSKKIVAVLKEFEDVNIGLVMKAVMSTPEWSDYSSRIAFVKSKSVQRLLSRKEIADVQKRIDRDFRRSLNNWIYSYKSTNSSEVTADLFVRLTHSSTSGVYSPPKISPRVLFTRSDQQGKYSYVTSVTLVDETSIFDTMFMERGLKTPENFTDLSWYSESGNEFSNMRKLMRVVASILSESPESLELVYGIYSALGIILPPVPNSIMSSFARKTTSKGTWTEADSYGPIPFIGVANTVPNRDLYEYTYDLKRCDRTTYLEAARSASSIISLFDSNKQMKSFSKVYIFNVSEGLLDYSFPNRPSRMREGSKLNWLSMPSNVPQNVSDEFITALKETSDYITRTGEVYENLTSDGTLDEDEVLLVIELSKFRMTKFLTSVGRHDRSGMVEQRTIPIPRICRDEVYRESIIEATLALMDPRARTVLETEYYSPIVEYSYQDEKLESGKTVEVAHDVVAPLPSISEEKLDLIENHRDSDDEEYDVYSFAYHESELYSSGRYEDPYEFEATEVERRVSSVLMRYNKKEERSVREQALISFVKIYNSLLGALTSAVMDIDDISNIEPIDDITDDIAAHLRKRVVGSIAVEGLMKPKLIIQTPTYPESKISPAHKSVFREILSATLNSIRTEFRKSSYNAVLVRRAIGFGYTGDIDELIDALLCIRACLRPSKHRGIARPYNQRTCLIELFKHFRIVEYVVRMAKKHREEDEDKIKRSRAKVSEFDSRLVSSLKIRMASFDTTGVCLKPPLTDDDRSRLTDEIKRNNRQSGEDHYAMLYSESLSSLWYRYKQYYRASYFGSPPQFEVSVMSVTNLLSAVYSSFLQSAISKMKTITLSDIEFRELYRTLDISRYIPSVGNPEESDYVMTPTLRWFDLADNPFDKDLIELLLAEAQSQGYLTHIFDETKDHEKHLALLSFDKTPKDPVSGERVSLNKSDDDADINIYWIKGERREVLSSYLNIDSEIVIASTLYEDREDGLLTLIMVLTDVPTYNIRGELRSDQTIELMTPLLCKPSKAARYDLVQSLTMKKVNLMTMQAFPTLSQVANTYSRMMGHKGTRITDAKELCTAFALISSTPSLVEQVTAYCLVDAYFRRVVKKDNTPTGFSRFVKECFAVLKDTEDENHAKLILDISYISAWLLRIRPTPKTTKDEEDLSDTVRRITFTFLKKAPNLGEAIMQHISSMVANHPDEVSVYRKYSLWEGLYRARTTFAIGYAFDEDFVDEDFEL